MSHIGFEQAGGGQPPANTWYSSVPTSSPNTGGSGFSPPPSYDQVTRPAQSFTLSYVDFTPQMTEAPGMFSKPKYERFDAIMAKANAWLRGHPDIRARTCESMEVKYRYDDGSGVDTEKSTYFESGKANTYFIRCLRLWIVPKDPNDAPEPQQLGYINVIPECADHGGVFSEPKFQSFGETIVRLNQMFKQQPLQGRILTVETQDMKFSSWKGGCDPDKSCWMEYGQATTYFLNVIRIFYEVGSPGYEEIGCADFVPVWLQQDGILTSGSTEPLGSVVQKAQSWLAHQQGCKLINVQSIDYKISSSWSGDTIDTQRSLFREYGERRTRFLRIVRVAYTRPYAGSATLSNPATLTYKTFMPFPVTSGGAFTMAKYETMSETMKRAMVWLNYSGVRIVSAETVTVRMYSGHQHLNPEQTYTWEPGERMEHHLYVLRVYMDGIPREPPPAALPPPPVIQSSGDDCCTLL